MIKELELIKPQLSPFKLIRIGGDKDGAYLLPNDLKDIEACFSPGVCNSKEFEDHLAIEYNIKSFMCDYSSDIKSFKTKLIKNMQFFEKKWLDINKNRNNISLENWINENTDNKENDLILQMDIEGAEYRNLLSCPIKVLKRFRILIIEFHELDSILENNKDNKVKQLIRKINETHTCVHSHPNNCCGYVIDHDSGMNIPRVLELTFLRKDRFKNKIINYSPEIPNRNDIYANVAWNKPLYLNINWLKPKKRSIISSIKILKDYTSYFFYKIYNKVLMLVRKKNL